MKKSQELDFNLDRERIRCNLKIKKILEKICVTIELKEKKRKMKKQTLDFC